MDAFDKDFNKFFNRFIVKNNFNYRRACEEAALWGWHYKMIEESEAGKDEELLRILRNRR